jgi:iron complex outermembrane recepter protein
MSRSRRRKLRRISGLAHHPAIRTGIPVASTLLASLPWTVAQAQEQEQTVGLQEVVVTAQKRVENLQDVPVAVQVLDNTKLEQLNITNVDAYVKYTPSLTYSRGNGQGGSGAPGQSLVYIRGVVNGGDGNHSGSQPSVGTYLDEQPITTIDGTPEVHLYDIARIEVLQGPQGTLFGASSEAGTVRIITNKPDPTKFSGNLAVEGNQVDHGGTGWSAEGFINVPIADWAAVRLVGWAKHDAGYIDAVTGSSANGCIVNGIRTFPAWSGQFTNPNGNVNYPVPYPCPTPGVVGAGAISAAPFAKEDFNTVRTTGGRAAVKLDIGQNWTVTPSAMAQHVKTEGFFGYDPQVGDLQVDRFGPDHTDDSWYQLALTVEGKMSDFDVTYAGAYFKRTNHTLAEYSDYSLFYDRVYGSGVFWTGNGTTPSNTGPIMGQEFVIGGGYFEKWSQELRVTTPSQYPIRGTVGGFLQRQLHNIVQQYTMPGYGYTHITSDPGVPGNPNGFSDYYSLPNLPNTIWLTAEQRVDRDKAIFAQFDWDITPQLMLTGGIRQYWFDNSLVGFFGYSANYSSHTGASQCFPGARGAAYVKNTPCTNLDTSTSDHGNVPKVTLTWKFAPDKMIYATYSKGFRPGGVNRIAGPNGVPYQPDYLKNYEIGWKTQWWDRRLRWNAALFWEDWKNFQFGFLVPPSITAITNAGNARIKGLENEIVFEPINRLMMSANFTFLHAVTTTDVCQGTAEISGPGCVNDSPVGAPFLPPTYLYAGPYARTGTDLPQVPKFKGNVVVRYTFSDIGSWAPYGQASYMYQSQIAPHLKGNEQAVIGFQPAYGLLDLAAGATHNGTELTLYISNVADERAQVTRFTNISANNDNQVYIVPTQPRTIGVRVSQNF